MPRRNGMGAAWWQGKFKGCGYRITLGREAIIDVLTKANKHLSAEDIYMRVHPKYPNIGLTTIYRTLDILVNIGIIFKFDFGDGRARYELVENTKGLNYHLHLICINCNRIIDYTDYIDDVIELIDQIEKGLSLKYNFKITNHTIQFYGFCKECAGKE